MVEFKKEHTKAEWIAMFEKAKELALTEYKTRWRIAFACIDVGIQLQVDSRSNNAIFTCDPYKTLSADYLKDNGNTDECVAAVFDNSIAAIRSAT